MTPLETPLPSLSLVKPNPPLHAHITLGWFTSEYGVETLLLMGNAAHEIVAPSLDSEKHILEEFIELEQQNEQLTWMIEFEKRIIGVAWIELTKNHNVLPPSVHLMIGDKEYRGRGIGKETMRTLMHYIKKNIPAHTIYSRHLKTNFVVANMIQSLGFIKDGTSYMDDELEWQNVKLSV